MEPVSTNLWVGSHGKKSLLHFDDYENVLMQLAGEKVRMIRCVWN